MEKGDAAYQEQIQMFAADVLPKLKPLKGIRT